MSWSWSWPVFITTLLFLCRTRPFPYHGNHRSLVLLGNRGEAVAAEAEEHPIRPSSEALAEDLGTIPGGLRPCAEVEAVEAVARGLGIQLGEVEEQGNPLAGELGGSLVGAVVAEAGEDDSSGHEAPSRDGEVSVRETEICCTSVAARDGRAVYWGFDSDCGYSWGRDFDFCSCHGRDCMFRLPGVDLGSGCGRGFDPWSRLRVVGVCAPGVMSFASALESNCSIWSANGLCFHHWHPCSSSPSSFRRTDGTSRNRSHRRQSHP